MLYFLSLGSNLGQREETLRNALRCLEEQIGTVTRCSSFYYSAPWGFASGHEFCNLCCTLQTAVQPLELLRRTQAIERQLGRTQKSVQGHYTDRTIDIDIINAFGDNGEEVTCNTAELTIPHPLWQQRDFVRIPLNEIREER